MNRPQFSAAREAGLRSDGDIDWRKIKAPFYMRQFYIVLYLGYISYAGGIAEGLLSLPMLLGGLLLYSVATAQLFLRLRRQGLRPDITRRAMRQDLFMLALGYIHDPYSSAPTVVAGLVILLGNGLRHGPEYFRESAVAYIIIIVLAGWLRSRFTPLGFPVDAAAVALFTIICIGYGQFLVSRLWQSRQSMLRISRVDDVSGLLTRRTFRSHASEQLETGARALLYLDLDHFKQINDLYGHSAGDAALLAVAGVIEKHAPPGALSSRYGGDEFVVLLPSADPEQLRSLQQALQTDIQALRSEWPKTALDVSIGLARSCAEGHSLDELLDQADHAMYQHKHSKHLAAPDPALQ